VLPFNDTDTAAATIDKHGSEIAAIILEPTLIDVGFIPGRAAFLQSLRDAADRHGIVLVFDELLTGFNVAVGGAASLCGVEPDLALYGKSIANGYPIAAIAGREDLMRMTQPGKGPAFVGTFNGHAVSVAAAAAALPILATGDVQREMSERGAQLKETFDSFAKKFGVPAQMVTGGSHIHWYFCEGEITDFRSATRSDAQAYRAFTSSLSDSNVLTLPNPLSHHAISLGHGDEACETLANAFESGLKAASNAP
ncbi:MAG: aminotransferase class III-fold pyridoxal phosphate-dependent enzyme, partial [Albidovulum sp.]|nr:aminotransferase class III-fold pyridoxal phosphate-dependent enzyme [Albidovulum sp.]